MALAIFLYLFFLFSSWTELVFFQNQAPSVKLTLMENLTIVKPGQQVPFAVSISDPEDGSSNYQEIPIYEVFVEIRYFESKPFNTGDTVKLVDQKPGLWHIKSKSCFDCHQWKTDLIGPAMDKIIRYYSQGDADQLANSIITGSVGNWGNEMMPAQEISIGQAQEIVDWMLGEDTKNIVEINRGLDGLFVADIHINQGYYVLTAGYRDHGIGQEMSNRKTGYHSVVLTIKN